VIRAGLIGLALGLNLIGGAVGVYVNPSHADPTSVGTAPAGAARAGGFHGVPPQRLRMVAAGQRVDVPVVPQKIADGTLGLPDDPKILGWWQQGSGAAANEGSTIIAGHVDTKAQGRGALYHLDAVKPGDEVSIGTGYGSVRYRVTARQVYDKQALPQSIFSGAGGGQLVLITCGGEFDASTGHYESNVVVYARAA